MCDIEAHDRAFQAATQEVSAIAERWLKIFLSSFSGTQAAVPSEEFAANYRWFDEIGELNARILFVVKMRSAVKALHETLDSKCR